MQAGAFSLIRVPVHGFQLVLNLLGPGDLVIELPLSDVYAVTPFVGLLNKKIGDKHSFTTEPKGQSLSFGS